MKPKLTQVFIAPLQTEDSVRLMDQHKYTLKVHPNATKPQMKEAAKSFWGVDVVSVNVVNTPGKKRTLKNRKEVWKQKPGRKAILTVAAGQSIDFNTYK